MYDEDILFIYSGESWRGSTSAMCMVVGGRNRMTAMMLKLHHLYFIVKIFIKCCPTGVHSYQFSESKFQYYLMHST